jgi:hypothetical protein
MQGIEMKWVAAATTLYNKDLYNQERERVTNSRGGNSVFRNEKNIALIIEFIASYCLPFQKV